jgi:small subunit ribosomal protein S16
MVRMRLRRTGAKNNPAYRIVVADQNSPRDGRFIDTLGHYLPTRQPHVVEIDADKARHWLSKGAQPSETVASLLRQKGITDDKGKVIAEGAVPAETSAPVAEAATAEAAAA